MSLLAYYAADWSEIHFLSKLSLPFCAFVFTLAENLSLLPGLHMQRSAQQQSLMKIVEGERSIKAAEKDPSTTVVASICSTDAAVVGSINATEFWQRRTRPPSFLLLLSRKIDLAIIHWTTLCVAAKCFCDSYLCTCFLHWCAVFHWKNLERNWGCSWLF